jgi:hypothetical protein
MLSIKNPVLVLILFLLSPCSFAQELSPSSASGTKASPSEYGQLLAPTASSEEFHHVVDRVVEREHFFVAQMRHMHPLVETYVQYLKSDRNHEVSPASDDYFLGRLDASNGKDDRSFTGQPGFGQRFLDRLTNIYSLKFMPLGFAEMVMLDEDFDKNYYDFTFVRREFLG